MIALKPHLPMRRRSGTYAMSLQHTLVAAAAAALAVAATTTAANATDFARTYEFSALFTPASPIDPVIGEIQVTFGSDLTDPFAGITIISLNVPLGSPIEWGYEPARGIPGSDFLQIGESASGINALTANTDDLDLVIDDPTSDHPTARLSLTSSETNVPYFDPNVSIHVVGGVPEASAWALMIVGVAVVGAAIRHRRRSVAA